MPEEWLPVEAAQMVCVLRADAPGAGRLEVVDQYGNLQGGMDVHQQMHVIRLAAKLQERAAPARQNLREDLSKVRQQQRRDGLAPILGHKHDMETNRIHRRR